MIRKFLEDLGLTKEQIDQIMDENNKDVEREKAKITPVISDRDTYKKQLQDMQTRLAAFDGVDIEKLKADAAAALQALKDADAKHQAELTRRDMEAETTTFLAGKRLVNPLVADALAAKLNAALDDPKNKGKNREDLFKGLTEDGEGKPLPGLFAEDNPHKPAFNLAPAGHMTSAKVAELSGQMGSLAKTTLDINKHRIVK